MIKNLFHNFYVFNYIVHDAKIQKKLYRTRYFKKNFGVIIFPWQAWPNFRHESKENTWVYRVALNTAVAQLRKRSRSPSYVLLTDEMVATLADLKHEELAESLYRLIDLLGKADKSLILLYLDKIPYDQIAEIVGISEAAARKRVLHLSVAKPHQNNHF